MPNPGQVRYMLVEKTIRLEGVAMHIYGEDWPLLVVETLSPIPGVVRYMLVVMSTRFPLVVMTDDQAEDGTGGGSQGDTLH